MSKNTRSENCVKSKGRSFEKFEIRKLKDWEIRDSRDIEVEI